MTTRCEAIRPSLSAHLDHETDAGLGALIEAHLRECSACREEMAALSATRDLLSRAGGAPAPRAWVREAHRAAAASVAGGAGDRMREMSRPRMARFGGRSLALSSGAAATLVAVFSAYLYYFRPAAIEAPLAIPQLHEVRAPMERRDGSSNEGNRPAAGRAEDKKKLDAIGGALGKAAGAPPQAPRTAPGAAPIVMPESLQPSASPAPSAAPAILARAAEPAPVTRVQASEIRFPAPSVAKDEISGAEPSTRPAREGSAPVALKSATAKDRAPERIVRLTIRVDRTGRILSAGVDGGEMTPEAEKWLARLPGASVAALADPASPAERELLLEIVEGPSGDR